MHPIGGSYYGFSYREKSHLDIKTHPHPIMAIESLSVARNLRRVATSTPSPQTGAAAEAILPLTQRTQLLPVGSLT